MDFIQGDLAAHLFESIFPCRGTVAQVDMLSDYVLEKQTGRSVCTFSSTFSCVVPLSCLFVCLSFYLILYYSSTTHFAGDHPLDLCIVNRSGSLFSAIRPSNRFECSSKYIVCRQQVDLQSASMPQPRQTALKEVGFVCLSFQIHLECMGLEFKAPFEIQWSLRVSLIKGRRDWLGVKWRFKDATGQ